MINKISPKYHLRIFLLILFFSIIVLLGRVYTTGSAIGGDAVYYYANLRSIVLDLDLNLENEYQYFYNQTSNFTKNRKIPNMPKKDFVTGKFTPKYPIGTAIFLLPTFLATHLLVRGDGYGIIYQTVAALTSLLYGLLGILLIYHLGKKLFDTGIAFWATIAIWLATPLIYYLTMEPLNSQPLSFFSVSLFLYLWFIFKDQNKFFPILILGLVGGLMSIVRYQDIIFLLIPIIYFFYTKKYFFSVATLFASSLPILIQLLINNYMFGNPFSTGVYSEAGFPNLASPKIFYSLLSLQRGLLTWSPIIIFALMGLYLFVKRFKLIGTLLLGSFLAQLYVISSWADPSQGDSFGNRILLNCSLIFALGFMQFLKNYINYQKLFLTLFAFLIVTNGILIELFVFRIIGQPY